MEQTDSYRRGGGRRGKEGKRTSQITCMSDPWTGTTVWRRTVGVKHGLGGLKGKMGTNE